MNVLAVGAHYDDIEIGCGLSLRKLKDGGANVYASVLTESDYFVEEDSHRRKKKAAKCEGSLALQSLGIQFKRTFPLPNQKMIYNQQVMQELERIVISEKIDLVFTHWYGDHNTDHKATWEMSRVAFRRVKNLLQYQSNSYFDNVQIFSPQYFWGFTKKEYNYKKKFLSFHSTEWNYRKSRWEREIFDKEKFWGYLIGYDYAEAFLISRLVQNNLMK